jgi:prophage maintenance system killer protein
MFLIEFEDLIYIHDQIIEKSGGAKGIRDEGVIKSAMLDLIRPLLA